MYRKVATNQITLCCGAPLSFSLFEGYISSQVALVRNWVIENTNAVESFFALSLVNIKVIQMHIQSWALGAGGGIQSGAILRHGEESFKFQLEEENLAADFIFGLTPCCKPRVLQEKWEKVAQLLRLPRVLWIDSQLL